MEFLSPMAGYLVLLAVPIILFYILKIRLRQENVSTILFWQQVFDERRTRSLWRRLRHLLSLLISLLFLSLLVAALLDPVLTSQKKEVRTVIIVDNSASMNAFDSGTTTRLDLAKAELTRFLAGTQVGMQTAIITAGGEPKVVVGFTNHLGTLRKMVAGITPTDYPTELDKAIELARHLVADEPGLIKQPNHSSITLVYTDGCSPDMEQHLAAEDLRFVPIGRPLDNVAITRFQPRRSIGDAIGYEILVETANFGESEVTCRLEIDLDDTPVDILTLTLAPNVPQTHIVRSTTDRGGLLIAKLNHTDAFPLDNTAMAVLPPRPMQKVLFYGESDFFLGHVLQSQQNIDLTVVAECPAVVPQDAVLIVHRSVPETIPPGNVLVIDPQNDSDFFRVGELLDLPLTANEAKDSPLMRFVHLNNVLMPGAKKLTPMQTGEEQSAEVREQGTEYNTLYSVLASTPEESPVYMLWQNPDRKLLVLSAELKRGDLPLRTAFPIMISNALHFFRDSGGELERAWSTGEAVTLPVTTAEQELALRSPIGEMRNFPVKSGYLSLGTLPHCGLWQILPQQPDHAAGHPSDVAPPIMQLACNLADRNESNLRSAPESFYRDHSQNIARAAAGRPIWFWLIIVAVLFTTAEWFLYQRRWID
ncbi:MAG: BatA and WFA domain-containing protein [Planctomycetaceae bacterium]|nr:BatA and WFA domain-containing protein [Planctomycetaceae bacterium]